MLVCKSTDPNRRTELGTFGNANQLIYFVSLEVRLSGFSFAMFAKKSHVASLSGGFVLDEFEARWGSVPTDEDIVGPRPP